MRRFILKLIGLIYISSLFLYASDSPGISGTVTTLPAEDIQRRAHLKTGWNLMGINANLTLEELKQQIGNDNLLIIITKGAIYKKIYPDDINTFQSFQDEKGYLIKVQNSSEITYTPKTYANKTIQLQKGWNIINPYRNLTLPEIKTQLREKLEIIIGSNGKIYKKIYPDDINTFTHFEEPYGYLIKVTDDATLTFR